MIPAYQYLTQLPSEMFFNKIVVHIPTPCVGNDQNWIGTKEMLILAPGNSA